jgi:hypothetical protein
MNQEIIEILKEIKSEEHLEMILPQKISKSLKSLGKSLCENCHLTEDDFVKINGLGKTKFKYLIEFNEQINDNPELIVAFKKHVLDLPIQIPSSLDTSKSIAYNLLQTINEFVVLLNERINLPISFFKKIEYNSYGKLCDYIECYFGLNNKKPLSLKDIAAKHKMSAEIIRINLFDYPKRSDLVRLFLRNEIGYGIKVNELLVDESKTLFENHLYSSTFIENFVFNNDDISEIQLERLAEVFDYTLVEINFNDSDYSFKTIVKKDEVSEFKAHYKVLDSILRNGLKLTKDALIDEMIKSISDLPNKTSNKKIKENGLNKRMFHVILDDYFKLEIIEEHDKQLYQFKWHYLSSLIDKTTIILFENGGVMSKEEIFEEFKSREDELGLDYSIKSIDFLFIKSTNLIHSQGKSGYWFYDENYTKEKKTIAQKVSSDIKLKFKGRINYDEFIKYTSETSFYDAYKKSSIRANVLLCARQTLNDSNIFIHNDFKVEYSEFELKRNKNKYLGNSIIKIIVELFETREELIEKNELLSLVLEKLSESKLEINSEHNILQYFYRFKEEGILNFIEKESKTYIQLDSEELQNHDLETLGKKQEPIYRTNIRAKAITYLKENNKVKLSEVFKLVEPLAPVDIAKNNIYKIFNDTSLFIKETIDNETWISLDTPKLPIPQEMHVEVSEETTEVLGDNPVPLRQLFDKLELKKAIINELDVEKYTYGLEQETVYKTFESFHDIVLNNNRNSIWGITLMQSIYENFCTKTDIYDRQNCVMNLIGSYETFLKLISPFGDQGRGSGIVEIIHSIPKINELYYYKRQEKYRRTDKQKDNFSYILNKVKYYADLYRHDRSSDELAMGNYKMMKFIVDFTALYLYTLYLVGKY